MAPKDQHLERLKAVPLFASCSKADLRRVARLAGELSYEAGTRMINQGDLAYEFFVIIAGRAKVTRNGRKIAEIGPGRSFGELGLLDQQPRSASVTALTDVDVLVIGRREFAGMIEETPGFARKLLQSLARRLHEENIRAIH